MKLIFTGSHVFPLWFIFLFWWAHLQKFPKKEWLWLIYLKFSMCENVFNLPLLIIGLTTEFWAKQLSPSESWGVYILSSGFQSYGLEVSCHQCPRLLNVFCFSFHLLTLAIIKLKIIGLNMSCFVFHLSCWAFSVTSDLKVNFHWFKRISVWLFIQNKQMSVICANFL